MNKKFETNKKERKNMNKKFENNKEKLVIRLNECIRINYIDEEDISAKINNVYFFTENNIEYLHLEYVLSQSIDGISTYIVEIPTDSNIEVIEGFAFNEKAIYFTRTYPMEDLLFFLYGKLNENLTYNKRELINELKKTDYLIGKCRIEPLPKKLK